MASDETLLMHIQKRFNLKRFEFNFTVHCNLCAICQDDSKVIGIGESITEAAIDLLCKFESATKIAS